MGTRTTQKDLYLAVEHMTATMRGAGILADDMSFVAYGAYGGWSIRLTGGELGTGQSEITGLGTLRETTDAARAVTRAIREATRWSATSDTDGGE